MVEEPPPRRVDQVQARRERAEWSSASPAPRAGYEDGGGVVREGGRRRLPEGQGAGLPQRLPRRGRARRPLRRQPRPGGLRRDRGGRPPRHRPRQDHPRLPGLRRRRQPPDRVRLRGPRASCTPTRSWSLAWSPTSCVRIAKARMGSATRSVTRPEGGLASRRSRRSSRAGPANAWGYLCWLADLDYERIDFSPDDDAALRNALLGLADKHYAGLRREEIDRVAGAFMAAPTAFLTAAELDTHGLTQELRERALRYGALVPDWLLSPDRYMLSPGLHFLCQRAGPRPDRACASSPPSLPPASPSRRRPPPPLGDATWASPATTGTASPPSSRRPSARSSRASPWSSSAGTSARYLHGRGLVLPSACSSGGGSPPAPGVDAAEVLVEGSRVTPGLAALRPRPPALAPAEAWLGPLKVRGLHRVQDRPARRSAGDRLRRGRRRDRRPLDDAGQPDRSGGRGRGDGRGRAHGGKGSRRRRRRPWRGSSARGSASSRTRRCARS